MPQAAESFETALSLAKQQLPAAFAVGGSLPFSGGITEIRSGQRVERGLNLVDNILPTGAENLKDLEQQHRELGFEAIAFYVPFHRPAPDGKWGIFYYDIRIREFAGSLRRDLGIPSPMQAADLAMEIIRRHELFHFRFDVFALHQGLTTGRPLYNDYSQKVYAKVHCTAECFEEALANRASIHGDWGKWAKTGLPIYGHLGLIGRLKRLCQSAPPGYRDFDRSEDELRRGLGGQLLAGSSVSLLPQPQSQWVGNAGPFERRANCPEYLLTSRRFGTSDGVQFRVKTGRYIWDFHRYDADPWPSIPHGHDRETGSKLSLRDGKIYDPRNRKPIDQEKAETVLRLREYLQKKWPDAHMDPADPQLALRGAPA